VAVTTDSGEEFLPPGGVSGEREKGEKERGEGAIYRGGHGVAVEVSRVRDRGRDQDDGFQ
jgi:hypothetical protein